MEKKMENEMETGIIMGFILGFYRDNGKENGNYYIIIGVKGIMLGLQFWEAIWGPKVSYHNGYI